MADVRLTATNPADSSVVPVACNEKGELKLEEIPDQSFDGILEGNLTVSGSAEFAGQVNITNKKDVNEPFTIYRNGTNRVRIDKFGALFIGSADGTDLLNNSNSGVSISPDGSATFADTIYSGGPNIFTGADLGSAIGYEGNAGFCCGSTSSAIRVYTQGNSTPTVDIKGNGSAEFAGNKAGFTKEGHLWCTTPRGDTVMLTATVGGAGMWEEYNPPTRRDQIKEWAEKNGIRPMPEESSQDEPETTQ